MQTCQLGPLASPGPSGEGRESWSREGGLQTAEEAGRQLSEADLLQQVEPAATAAVGVVGESAAVVAVDLVAVDAVESIVVAVDLLFEGVA